MAKSKSFFGLRRGSTKSLTFQVLDGVQITKDRVTEVRNPRTNRQLYQRAIMATILMMYSAGKSIFDHSFQGKSVGAQCQRTFMSINAKMLREALANDMTNNLIEGNVTARCVVPGATSPVPNAYIISRGGYNQNFFVYDDGVFTYADKQANESCAAYCNRTGLVPGDIYTILAVTHEDGASSENWSDSLSAQKKCSFGFVRLMVKDNALSDTTEVTTLLAAASATAGAPFVITEKFNCNLASIPFAVNTEIALADLGFSSANGAFGIIRSRFDQDLRSDSVMHVVSATAPNKTTGLANPYILPVWQAGTKNIGDSDLILEGGDFL